MSKPHASTMTTNGLFLAMTFMVCCGASLGQDPDFSQFLNQPVLTNPAYAGAYGMPGQQSVSPRLTMAHRNRWPNLSSAFVTSSISLDTYMPTIKGGIGLRVLQDDAGHGTIGTRNVGLALNVGKRITRRVKLNAALDLGYFEKSLDWSLLTYYDQIDPNAGFVYVSQEVPRGGVVRGLDLGAGLLVHHESWAVGIAGHHLNEPDHSLSGSVFAAPLPIRWTGHAHFSLPIKNFPTSTGTIDPSMRYWRQGEFELWEAGLQVVSVLGRDASGLSERFQLGIWYRGFPDRLKQDALVFSAGWESYAYRINYSWDMTYSALTPNTGGAHEVVLTIYFPGSLPGAKRGSGGNLRSQRLHEFCPECDWNMLNTRQWLPIRPQKWKENNDMDSIRGN